MLRATEKHKWVRAVKSKPKALGHYKIDPVIKIDDTFFKQAESMLLLEITHFDHLSLRFLVLSVSNSRPHITWEKSKIVKRFYSCSNLK